VLLDQGSHTHQGVSSNGRIVVCKTKPEEIQRKSCPSATSSADSAAYSSTVKLGTIYSSETSGFLSAIRLHSHSGEIPRSLQESYSDSTSNRPRPVLSKSAPIICLLTIVPCDVTKPGLLTN
jgi:hypothetical protein